MCVYICEIIEYFWWIYDSERETLTKDGEESYLLLLSMLFIFFTLNPNLCVCIVMVWF